MLINFLYKRMSQSTRLKKNHLPVTEHRKQVLAFRQRFWQQFERHQDIKDSSTGIFIMLDRSWNVGLCRKKQVTFCYAYYHLVIPFLIRCSQLLLSSVLLWIIDIVLTKLLRRWKSSQVTSIPTSETWKKEKCI